MVIPRAEQVRYRRIRPAAKVARTDARAVAHRWGLDHLADDLESITGELVANAVVHGRAARGSQVVVTYRVAEGTLRIDVRDWATGAPRIVQSDDSEGGIAERGRGLAIVRELSLRWGVVPRVIGKSVWCELDIEPGH